MFVLISLVEVNTIPFFGQIKDKKETYGRTFSTFQKPTLRWLKWKLRIERRGIVI